MYIHWRAAYWLDNSSSNHDKNICFFCCCCCCLPLNRQCHAYNVGLYYLGLLMNYAVHEPNTNAIQHKNATAREYMYVR